MHRDDLLTQVRIRARLYGRNHARRVVQAVMRALQKVLPETAYHGLAVQLPAEVRVTTPGRRQVSHHPTIETSTSQQLIRDVADELHITGPDAAFYTRVTFEQLNAFCRGVTPATLAESLPVDLRPLLSARVDHPAHGHRLMRMLGPAATMLSLRAPARDAADPAPHSAVAARRTGTITKQTQQTSYPPEPR